MDIDFDGENVISKFRGWVFRWIDDDNRFDNKNKE